MDRIQASGAWDRGSNPLEGIKITKIPDSSGIFLERVKGVEELPEGIEGRGFSVLQPFPN